MTATQIAPRYMARPAVQLDRLVLGDNQFFGVNHMSEEKARAQAMQFQDLRAILDVIDAAYDEGVRTFMCTTHDRVGEVAAHVRANPSRYEGFAFYPCMPYAHKYANAVTEDGLLGALRRFLPEQGFVNAAVRGGRSFASKDIEGIVTLLIDAEMAMFRGLKTPVIFLQNVVVDLLLGLGFVDAFRIFADHVRTAYDAEPGFITMNLPAARRRSRLGRHRQPDHLLEHQQARVPDVRRHGGLRGDPARAAVPGHGHVGVRLRGDPAARGPVVGVRAARHRVDRLRCLEPPVDRVDQEHRRRDVGSGAAVPRLRRRVAAAAC